MTRIRNAFLLAFTAAVVLCGTLITAQTSPGLIEKEIDAAISWQSTEVEIKAGQYVEITATGTWTFGEDTCDADGVKGKKTDDLLPGMERGTLLAKVGKSVYRVGKSFSDTISQAGTIYLAGQDPDQERSDDSGTLKVKIRTFADR